MAGQIVTGDTIHTQWVLWAQIVACYGHYFWPIKEIQPRLYEDIHRLFAPEQSKPGYGQTTTDSLTISIVNLGHRRLEKRTIHTNAMLNDYLDWAGIGRFIVWNTGSLGSAKVGLQNQL